MINAEVYMDLTLVIYLKYTGNTREMHGKYTDYTLTVHEINLLLHIHFTQSTPTISASITPNTPK